MFTTFCLSLHFAYNKNKTIIILSSVENALTLLLFLVSKNSIISKHPEISIDGCVIYLTELQLYETNQRHKHKENIKFSVQLPIQVFVFYVFCVMLLIVSQQYPLTKTFFFYQFKADFHANEENSER